MLDCKVNPVLCALDTKDLDHAKHLCGQIRDYVGGIKLGLEFFTMHGSHGVKAMSELGIPIFLDLKFHDIPNTVAEAVKSAMELEVDMLTLHLSGGSDMLKKTVDAVRAIPGKQPLLVGVSVLTSMSEEDLKSLNIEGGIEEHVVRLAHLGQDSGLDGLVCSAHELSTVRQACGDDFITVVPGIRMPDNDTDDQKRVMTPDKALALGANFLVIGRPITKAAEPAVAAKQIFQLVESTR